MEVRWDGLPAGVEEMELLVSVDGGSAFARAADLDPATGSYRWVVPGLPTSRAVLALRANVDGEETVLFRTVPFAIGQATGPALEPLSYHGGELWTDDAGRAAPVADGGVAGTEPGSSVDAQGLDEPFDDSPDGLDLPVPADTGSAPSSPARLPALRSGSSPSRAPLVFPRRE